MSGLGSAQLLVATCSHEHYPDILTSSPIRSLDSQLHDITNKKNALEEQIDILNQFGKSMADKPNITPENAGSFSDVLFEKIISNSAAVRDLDEKITQLTRQISRLGSARTGSAHVKAVVTIVANEAGPVQLKLTYREFRV